MADVVIISRDDWANVGFSFQQALNAVGVDALAIKERPHVFDYGEEALVVGLKRAREEMEKAKVLLFMHSRGHFTRKWPDDPILKNRFVAVFHGGTTYRTNPVGVSRVFGNVDATIIQTADLLGLGAKNEHWVMPPVDTEAIEPQYSKVKKPYVLGHYPRQANLKGSDTILRVAHTLKARDLEFEWLYGDKLVTWAENLERMAACDVYIERMKVVDKQGNLTGEWGVTALEASALGKAIVTNFRSQEKYETEFGKCPFFVANSEEELEELLEELINAHPNKIRSAQRRTREWVEEFHSFKAVGARLAKALRLG